MIEVVCRHVLRIEPWKPLAEPKATNSRRYGGCLGILTLPSYFSQFRGKLSQTRPASLCELVVGARGGVDKFQGGS